MRESSAKSTGRRLSLAAAGVLVSSLLLSGCGDSTAPVGVPFSSSPAPIPSAVAEPKPLSRSVPTTIKIPKIDVSSPVIELGLQSNGHVQVPPVSTPKLAGWYENGPSPGEIGPSVIIGHIDGHGMEGVFYRLRQLSAGDKIEITRQDDSVATFVVQRVQMVAKTNFPSQQVYSANINYAGLRLVTCGGAFDRTTGHYIDSTIVYAKLTDTT